RAGDDAVAGDLLSLHAEVDRIVLDEHVIFFEAAWIEQDAEPLARGQSAFRMLRCNPLLATAESRQLTTPFEFLNRSRQARLSSGRLPFHAEFVRSIGRAGVCCGAA